MAIIGHGDIATVLKEVDRDDLLFFASGVSNSQEKRESEYEREIRLLAKQDATKHLVYFSSLCVFESNSRYADHKRTMEQIIKTNFPLYTIVRIGNITFGKNPHTIVNYLRNKIHNNEQFEVKDVYRYLVNKDELLYWLRRIPDWSCELNVTGRRVLVKDMVEEIKKGLL